MSSLPNWATEAIDLLATAVANKLQKPSDSYTSITLPIGVNKRTFHRRCATIAEAKREGRLWRCPVPAWHTSFDVERTADEPDAYAAAVAKAGRRRHGGCRAR